MADGRMREYHIFLGTGELFIDYSIGVIRGIELRTIEWAYQ